VCARELAPVLELSGDVLFKGAADWERRCQALASPRDVDASTGVSGRDIIRQVAGIK
jgi:hypothetical protein